MTPLEAKDIPDVSWDCDEDAFYTLSFVDLDVLSKNNRLLDEGRRWLVGNIINCDVGQGQTIVEYLSPTAVCGSGEHRYVFVLFKQKGKLVFEEPFVSEL